MKSPTRKELEKDSINTDRDCPAQGKICLRFTSTEDCRKCIKSHFIKLAQAKGRKE